MVTWAQKVAFLDMQVIPIPSGLYDCRYKVRLYRNPGISTFGDGDSIEEAIESAAWRMGIDWGSVARKITEREWEKISHT